MLGGKNIQSCSRSSSFHITRLYMSHKLASAVYRFTSCLGVEDSSCLNTRLSPLVCREKSPGSSPKVARLLPILDTGTRIVSGMDDCTGDEEPELIPSLELDRDGAIAFKLVLLPYGEENGVRTQRKRSSSASCTRNSSI